MILRKKNCLDYNINCKNSYIGAHNCTPPFIERIRQVITLDEVKRHKKISYDIFPGKLLSSFLTIIATILTIYFAVNLLDIVQRIIAGLALIIIFLVVILIKSLLRLRVIIKKYNLQSAKLDKADDNRNTLEEIVKDKNTEIDNFKNEKFALSAQVNLLLYFLSLETRPDTKIIEQALRIKQEEVIDSDE